MSRMLHYPVPDGTRPARVVTGLVLSLVASSCSPDSTAPSPPLEAVDFGALGSGKVMFQRIHRGYDAVYVIDADAQRVTIALEKAWSPVRAPSISPTGNQVAWLGLTFGNTWPRLTFGNSGFDVYLTDLSGGSPKRLTNYPSTVEGSPSWTPAGDAVAFMVTSLYDWGIHLYELASGSLTTARAFHVRVGVPIECPTMTDGLASVSNRGSVAWLCRGAVYAAMSPADTIQLLYSPASFDERVEATFWSPDGQRLAFLEVHHTDIHAGIMGGTATVKLLDIATGAVSTLASVVGSGGGLPSIINTYSLCWLWSANKLVFNAPGSAAGTLAASWSLYVVAADGSGLVRLTTAPDAFDYSVSCSG